MQEIKKNYVVQQVKAIKDAAESTLGFIHDRSQKEGLKFIFEAKFDKIGYNPLKIEMKMNVMEQINQSITLLTTYWILNQHLGQYFRAHLGERTGTDFEIFETDKENSPKYIFEIFAATDPYQNRKLLKDIQTVVKRKACAEAERSVCFCSPMPFKTSVIKYFEMQINWKEEINPDSTKEMKKYICIVQEKDQKKEIGIIWIKNETLLSWAVNLIKAAGAIK